jgi:hypothetical protein
MENLSTENHATLISESVLNGQHKQAVDLFERAIADDCDANALLADIGEQIGAGRALIRVAAAYITRGQDYARNHGGR